MPEKINIKSDSIICAARGQAVVEARQNVEGNCKILSVSASAVAQPSEVFAGEARYAGKVEFDCLVSTDDGIKCVAAVAEFSDKISSPDIAATSQVALVPEVINTEAQLDGSTVKMIAVIDVTLICTAGEETECLSAVDDGIYAQKRTIKYGAASAQTETAYIADSVPAENTAEVMFPFARIVVTSAECSDGEIKIAGAAYTFAVVKLTDGMTSCRRVVTPFVKSMAAMGASAGDAAYVTAAITDLTVTLAEESRLDIAVTASLNAIVVSPREAEAVTDVFCADCEIDKKTVTICCQTAEPPVTVIDNVDGQIPIPADKNAADAILCVNGAECALSEVKIEDGRVNAEGLVSGDIVYYNAEKNAADALAFKLPFSIPLSVHTDADKLFAACRVTDVNVRIRRESVFDIKAELAFTILPVKQEQCECIASAEKGEPIPRPDAAVIVHIAKPGETLWEAARALCCSPERVTEQNSASAPYSGGERLINFCNK